ncbi:MAG TPA: hypothetical protein PKY83_01500 [Bacteroidales bacterium]|jgi:hypothetical protein|nr:hypothetical protein [Bacteroidales bacterium]MCZ2417643.1 hypothetical protein [Burkholderiales bacterium]OQC58544.1 MAG: hypothetical protein BWX52_00212 [Bacteroidetes bacterium ADurb.Bin013]MBP8999393.1 hypothetical protein [Bacteroidales bacterium]MBV6455195.1 hypothetical protein [Bacteroidales bacterium]
MDEREYREIKELLAQLTARIDALYTPAPAPVPVPDTPGYFELETPSVPVSPTLKDKFSGLDRRPTLADSLAKTKNKGLLKEVIPLNDKYLYLKTLFSEDSGLYEKTIADLQSFKDMQQAEAYLAQHFPSWELSTPAVQKFLTQLENVF